jgi:2-polyprenyl-3-methyl-5-hydroxy-6-metoxy-1,4-benzoquinol methylase
VTESRILCPLCGSDDLQKVEGTGTGIYYRCGCCRLIHLAAHQRLDSETELSRYQLHNNVPDAGYTAFLSRLAQPLSALLPRRSYGLDFGCGPGPVLAAMLRRLGHTVDTYDPYFADNLQVFSRRYDFITATEVAEHLYHPGREFDRLFSMLAPSGLLGIMTRMIDETVDFTSWYYRRDPTHVCFYARESFAWIAEAHHAEIVTHVDDVIIMKARG